MNRLLMMLALAAVLLGGCGGSAAGAPSSAEAVHAAWVKGLQHNDREALIAIADAGDLTSTFVDQELNRTQGYLQDPANGKLQTVDVRAPVDDGAGKTALSVWRFERKIICWQATLAEAGGAWKVTAWGVVVEACKEEQ